MKKRKITIYVLAITILMLSVLFMGASCSSSTANISNAVMTTGIDANSLPIDNMKVFPLDSIPYVTAELHNAPDNTSITFVWYANNQEMNRITISNDNVSDAPVYSYLPATMAAQPGNYSVEIYVDDRTKPDTVTDFVIADSTASITNAQMTTGIDANYLPIDRVTKFPVNTMAYVTAEMKNAPVDTSITFVWYGNGHILDNLTIGNEGVTNAPIYSNLPPEMTSQPGNYSVEIYIDDRADPDTVTEFIVQ